VATKLEGHGFTSAAFEGKSTTEVGEGSKATAPVTSTVGVKRKRPNFSEEILMMTNMIDVVNNVASALRETGAAHVDSDLYLAVMEMHGFTTEALIVVYTYLLKNKAIGTGFVKIAISHREIWLRNYLTKNYYM
jgi:hypothetical protein